MLVHGDLHLTPIMLPKMVLGHHVQHFMLPLNHHYYASCFVLLKFLMNGGYGIDCDGESDGGGGGGGGCGDDAVFAGPTSSASVHHRFR